MKMILLPVYQETFTYYARFIFIYIFVYFDTAIDLTQILALLLLSVVAYPVILNVVETKKKKRKKLLVEMLKKLDEAEEIDLNDLYYRVTRAAPRVAERIMEILKRAKKPMTTQDICKEVGSNYPNVINVLNVLADAGILCRLENLVNLVYKDYIYKGNPNCPLKNRCNNCSTY